MSLSQVPAQSHRAGLQSARLRPRAHWDTDPCTQRSRNCSCVPSGPSSRNAGVLTRKRVGLCGKGRQMHTLPATSYKVYFFLRVMILNFLKEHFVTLLTLKWGALKVTKQCLISPPEQDWATTGSLRGSE